MGRWHRVPRVVLALTASPVAAASQGTPGVARARPSAAELGNPGQGGRGPPLGLCLEDKAGGPPEAGADRALFPAEMRLLDLAADEVDGHLLAALDLPVAESAAVGAQPR
jgi:hypothetical protein